MKKDTLVKINFCFPNISTGKRGKKMIVDEIIRFISNDEKIGYAGFLKKDGVHGLRNWISRWFSENSIEIYKELTKNDKENLEKVVRSTIQECFDYLPLPLVSVFIFPWVQTFDEYSKIMGLVTGYTPYASVVHIYIVPERFSYQFLKGTIAHEFNHAVFFNYHKKNSQTIREAIIFEGLAENFEEDITMTHPPIVSRALTKEESLKALIKIQPVLDVMVNWNENGAYKNIFFGGNGYKRWTGYSVGYYIVKEFREVYPNKPWKEIMKINTKQIFALSPFVQRIKKGGVED